MATGNTLDTTTTRRTFLDGMLATGAAALLPGYAAKAPGGSQGAKAGPVKFLFMADHHVESDFMERGHEVYTMWRPGNHAALEKTYEFIGSDPYCRDIDFALFGGDQLNTGYMNHPKELAAEREIYYRTLGSLDLYRRTKGKDLPDLDFRASATSGSAQEPTQPRKPDSRVIAIQGNHDTGVPQFFRECSFKCGDTRFITFFASYVALPAPPRKFRSTAKVSDEAVAFIEREMAAAAADPAIRHIVLVSHWAIAPRSKNFVWPILDACKENGFNDNRRKILALAEKYGCDLYINGHEHNGGYPVERAGSLSDISCASVTGGKASWAIVEMHPDRAVFNVYSRAHATEAPDGTVTYSRLPQRLFTREIPLKPIR